MTQGQLLQVNFAPVWHGRMIGEAQNVMDTICMQQNVEGGESVGDFLNRRINARNDDVAWLTEMRSHPVIFFDLTLNILHPVEQHERAFLLFIDRLICVLAQRELPGAFCDMPDGMEHIGQ